MRTAPALAVAVALGAGLLLLRSAPAPLSVAVARKLASFPAEARARFTALLAEFEAHGYRVEITSTYRADDKRSQHYKWRALDLNVVHVATGRRYLSTTPLAAWEATGLPAIIQRRGFRWGGYFRTSYVHNGQVRPAYDPVHIDMGLLPTA